MEYICINDGSTDNSLKICESFAEKDSRFIVINQKNGGPSRARNVGLHCSRGEYVCFVDADDYLEPGALKHLYFLARGWDIVIHSANAFSENGPVPEWVEKNLTTVDVALHNFQVHDIFTLNGTRPFLWQHFVRTAIIKENNLQFNEDLVLGEDQLFEIEYFLKANKVLSISDKLYNYRVNRENSLMTVYSKNINQKIEQHLLLIESVINVLYPLANEDESLVISWMTELFYWDLIKLLYNDQCAYIPAFIELLNRVNYLDHLSDVKPIICSMIKQITLVEKYFDNPQKIIEELTLLKKENENELNRIQSSLVYKIKRLFS